MIPRIGERRAILLGLTIGVAGFLANVLVPYGWMVYAVFTFSALQGLVFPSMNSTLSKRVESNEQGELQGAISSLRSVALIIGPGLFTFTFAYFIDEKKGWNLPGAPWFLGAALLFVAMTLAMRVTKLRPRLAAETSPANE